MQQRLASNIDYEEITLEDILAPQLTEDQYQYLSKKKGFEVLDKYLLPSDPEKTKLFKRSKKANFFTGLLVYVCSLAVLSILPYLFFYLFQGALNNDAAWAGFVFAILIVVCLVFAMVPVDEIENRRKEKMGTGFAFNWEERSAYKCILRRLVYSEPTYEKAKEVAENIIECNKQALQLKKHLSDLDRLSSEFEKKTATIPPALLQKREQVAKQLEETARPLVAALKANDQLLLEQSLEAKIKEIDNLELVKAEQR